MSLIASTTLTTLTFFATLPLLPSLGVTKPSHAAVLLSLYHLPSLVLHPYLLHTRSPSSLPYKALTAAATTALLWQSLVTPIHLLPLAYLLLGSANSGLETIAALSEPPETLSKIDFLGTVCATLAPLLYHLHKLTYIPFGVLLFVSLVLLLTHRPAMVESTQPLLEKEQPTLSAWPLLSVKTARPMLVMLFSTASLTLLHASLATAPSPLLLGLLALSALSEPFSTNLLPLGAKRITLAGTMVTATGTYLLRRWLCLGIVLLGGGASAAAVVSVADIAESAGVVFDNVRSAVALLAGVAFAVGQIVGCLIGGLDDFVEIWEFVCVVVVAVAMTPFLAGLMEWCVRQFKGLFMSR